MIKMEGCSPFQTNCSEVESCPSPNTSPPMAEAKSRAGSASLAANKYIAGGGDLRCRVQARVCIGLLLDQHHRVRYRHRVRRGRRAGKAVSGPERPRACGRI